MAQVLSGMPWGKEIHTYTCRAENFRDARLELVRVKRGQNSRVQPPLSEATLATARTLSLSYDSYIDHSISFS